MNNIGSRLNYISFRLSIIHQKYACGPYACEMWLTSNAYYWMARFCHMYNSKPELDVKHIKSIFPQKYIIINYFMLYVWYEYFKYYTRRICFWNIAIFRHFIVLNAINYGACVLCSNLWDLPMISDTCCYNVVEIRAKWLIGIW